MENKKSIAEALKEYFENTTEEQVQKDWDSCVREPSEFDVTWDEYKIILKSHKVCDTMREISEEFKTPYETVKRMD